MAGWHEISAIDAAVYTGNYKGEPSNAYLLHYRIGKKKVNGWY